MSKPSYDRPANATFSQWMESRCALHSTRRYDWGALKFLAADTNSVPSEHFTFSTMIIPAGHEGPMHLHTDVEEVFFVLRGKVKVMCEQDGHKWEAVLGERDLISIPPGVYRGEINIGEEDVLMCVMLGAATPITPTYPADHPLAKIKREMADKAATATGA
jgi:mannose-6-phosphate isomerase-like protein (cupin superfamily)